MIKAVFYNIDNLKKLEKKERYTVNTRPVGPLKVIADFKVSTKINWLALGAPDNLDWDVILAAFSVSISENSLVSVRHL